MVYDYDLISGKVNQVAYQPGLKDEFYHRYNYDAENRLVEAYTSHDKLIWEKDARYSYYRHGPLARTNLGQQQVQGIDYAYTLQGWLKGINSTAVQQPDLITGNGEDCGPGSAVENLLVNARLNPLSLQYVARSGITFDPGFESTGNDDFTAYIDNSLIFCGPNGTAGTVPAALAGNMFDIGQDGVLGADGKPSQVAKDVYGFGLNYFTGDYKPIGKVIPFGTFTAPSPSTTGGSLFNGNISSMAVNIPKLGQAYLYGYRYDQLNRIVAMDAFTGGTTNNSQWGLTATQNYKERISYDANGNILTYNRSGNTGNHNMDSLTYKYPTFENTPANIQAGVVGKMINNRLRYVHDAYSTPALTEDIESQTLLTLAAVQAQQLPAQAGDNFAYDEIGNLIKDTKEGIDNITWNVYGKILSITKDGNTISYSYDASGNRISKTASGKKSIYVRDASGNVMSVYSTDQAVSSGNLIQDEVHLYGSSRLGIFDVNRNVQLLGEADYLNNINTFARGNKFFELSNHLGNVLVTVSDKKIGVDRGEYELICTSLIDPITEINYQTCGVTQISSEPDGRIDYYSADVITATDYYPFGMQMPGRKFSAGSSYRYGFNGKENDNEVKGEGNQQDYGMRIYDPRLGRFLSVDPLQTKYPFLTPFAFSGNNPIQFADNAGMFPIDFRLKSFLTKNSYYLTGFIYGIGDGIIETGAMGFSLNKTLAAFNPVHISGYAWTEGGSKTRQSVKSFVQTTVSIAGDREAAMNVYSSMKAAFGDWWNVTFMQGGTKGEQGYSQGKLVFDIAALFVGAGEIKGLMKGGRLAEETVLAIREGLEEASQVAGKKAMPEWLKLMKEGTAFENSFFDNLGKSLEEGSEIIRRVSFKAADGTRAVVDGVVKNADGSYRFIETKLRKSTQLTTNQKKVYKALQDGTATAVGENAEKAGFKTGQKVTATVERVEKFND